LESERNVHKYTYAKIDIMKKVFFILGVSVLGAVFALVNPADTSAATYTFPVIGNSTYANDYYSGRSNGYHYATDIIADKHQKVVSATDGTITNVTYPEPYWGNAVTVLGDDGICYWYLHLNDDNYGTDDGRGGAMKAYAPDMKPGNRIVRGQHIGYIGDSGNAESTVSHLHFEMVKAENGRCRGTGGEHKNPYYRLKNDSTKISQPATYPELAGEKLPFGNFSGKVNVARGDVAPDVPGDEIIVSAGKPGKPYVRIYSDEQELLRQFYAFDSSNRRGVDVAVGDTNGDGIQEIIAGVSTSKGPRVAIYTFENPSVTKQAEFSVFGRSGYDLRVSAGDVYGEGKDQLIVSLDAGSVPSVHIYDETGKLLKAKHVAESIFRGGIDVASADVTGDVKDELIVSKIYGKYSSSLIQVFASDLKRIKAFYSHGSKHRGGVHLDAGNTIQSTPKAEIVTMPNDGYPTLKHFNFDGETLRAEPYWEQWWRGYYDVATGDGAYSAVTGDNRRASLQ